jgi:hypothetical protein
VITIQLQDSVHLIIKKGSYRAEAKPTGFGSQLQVLRDMSGIHINIAEGSLAILPGGTGGNGTPDKRTGSVLNHGLTQSCFSQGLAKISLSD